MKLFNTFANFIFFLANPFFTSGNRCLHSLDKEEKKIMEYRPIPFTEFVRNSLNRQETNEDVGQSNLKK